MASAACASDFEESELVSVLDDCLQDFPNIQALRKEQQLCVVNLACGKDVFSILSTDFGKSLIFQFFPRLAKAAMKSEIICSIVVVSPLVSEMRDQVKQLKQLGSDSLRQQLDPAKNTTKTRKRREKGSVKLFLEIKNLRQACTQPRSQGLSSYRPLGR